MKTLIATLLCLTAGASVAAATNEPAALQRFSASYGVVWRGFNAGTTALELTRGPDGEFVYTSRANARGLFRAVFSD